MEEQPRFRFLWFKFTYLIYVSLSGAMDLVFLGIWIYAQYWFHHNVAEPFKLEGMDEVLIRTAQYLFGAVTLIFVVAHLIRDIARLVAVTIIYISQTAKAVRAATSPPNSDFADQQLTSQPANSDPGKEGNNGSSSV
ncbi:MAG TPA: hypothetical protein VGE45_14535 [Chloroflexia bacterium]|jgi:hypothetical protein